MFFYNGKVIYIINYEFIIGIFWYSVCDFLINSVVDNNKFIYVVIFFLIWDFWLEWFFVIMY